MSETLTVSSKEAIYQSLAEGYQTVMSWWGCLRDGILDREGFAEIAAINSRLRDVTFKEATKTRTSQVIIHSGRHTDYCTTVSHFYDSNNYQVLIDIDNSPRTARPYSLFPEDYLFLKVEAETTSDIDTPYYLQIRHGARSRDLRLVQSTFYLDTKNQLVHSFEQLVKDHTFFPNPRQVSTHPRQTFNFWLDKNGDPNYNFAYRVPDIHRVRTFYIASYAARCSSFLPTGDFSLREAVRNAVNFEPVCISHQLEATQADSINLHPAS